AHGAGVADGHRRAGRRGRDSTPGGNDRRAGSGLAHPDRVVRGAPAARRHRRGRSCARGGGRRGGGAAGPRRRRPRSADGADRALIVCGREQRDALGRVSADLLVLYENLAEPLSSDELRAVSHADWIAFASPAAVQLLAEATGGAIPHGPRSASVDPATSEALRSCGREPDLEAALHTRQGLVDSLAAAATTTSVASVPA